MFEPPIFELWPMIYTAIGAVVLWGKLGFEARKIYVLSDVFDHIGMNKSIRIIFELSLFVTLACLFSAGVVRPSNVAQAVTAGLGWTGMLSGRREAK